MLDFEGEGQPVQNPKADIIGLLNGAIDKANKKPITQPYVIFIDLNLPPSQGSVFEKPWFRELKQRVERQLGEATPSKPDAFNMVVFTNHPLHYGHNNQPSPPLERPVILVPNYSKHSVDRTLLYAIHEAAEKFGSIPRGFPVYP